MAGTLKSNLEKINQTLKQEKDLHPSLAEPTVVAVSKKQPAEKIRELYALGIKNFGENYLQEAVLKIQELKDLKIEWHYIGALQTKKIKEVAENFQWVHTVSREVEIEKLSGAAADLKKIMKIFIQVNIAGEDSKQGVAPGELIELIEKTRSHPELELRGLMFFPPLAEKEEDSLNWFRKAKALFDSVKAETGSDFTELSMGTSSDYHLACRCGATHLRIGETLMGKRG